MLNHREQLQAIRTFPQLIKYLRDELDWPISQDDFEDLTFEYTPEELGIDFKVAAKIQEIRRLRPLSVHQPWGIFFVKFEPKRLPVVAMRRMLNAVAIKNRASAVNADKITWASDDLLFISNYGDEENRQITFAHFTQNQIKKDLPTLKVLGWDNRDTALHLDYVSENLSAYLTWPADEKDVDAWRNSWTSAFSVAHREVIDTAKKLSIHLAHLARNIRDRINTVLDYETENGPITKLMNAFKEALVHDLDNDGFADMYAQTIAYGLLSARIANPSGKTADDFASAMPVTNPFLKELMETFIDAGGRESKQKKSIRLDFDELGVSDVVELLDDANMEAVVRDFGDKNPLEDPVTHFYEQFFADYDNSERFKRGVFYTPRPVVSCIVRSVDELLRSEFGLEYGLADTTTWGEMADRMHDFDIPEGIAPQQSFVQILDPATGTGTFLVEVIQQIHGTMVTKWQGEGIPVQEITRLWNDYVPKHLLPRLHGYELMMAPYAIAHLKISLKLHETGYKFESEERARVYLTNTLELPSKEQLTLDFLPAMAHEVQAVNEIKRNLKFTVIIGNPPYSVSSSNKSHWIVSLLQDYKKDLNENNIQPLSDDYIKFIRFGQEFITKSGEGILAYISNNSFLDGLIHRQMRKSIIEDFDHVSIINLHGNSNLKETSPDGSRDENVFDIRQGVSINIFVKREAKNSSRAKVIHSDVYGSRGDKHNILLVEDFKHRELQVQPPNYFFIPVDDTLLSTYSKGFSIADLFTDHSGGVQTKRDRLFLDNNKRSLELRINKLLSGDLDKEFIEKYNVSDSSSYRMTKKILNATYDSNYIRPISYFPFDSPYIYYDKQLLGRPFYKTMRHFLQGDNIGLVVPRQNKEAGGGFITQSIIGQKLYSAYDINYVFPLYYYPEETGQQTLEGNLERHPNLDKEIVAEIARTITTKSTRKKDDAKSFLNPIDLLDYIYAILHSPSYCETYKGFLKVDFPRIPYPKNSKLFWGLVTIGSEIRQLHLLESPKLDNFITNYSIKGDNKVTRRINSRDWEPLNTLTGRVMINDKQYFDKVPLRAWLLKIGGYQPAQKWLKDRSGSNLSNDDIVHYQKIIVALTETIRLKAEIDEVIEAHGGWPGAFQT